jgi:hypothetical protein
MKLASAIIATASVLMPLIAAGQEAPKPATDQAKVTVYRYKQFAGKGLRPSIYCNDKDVARIQNGRYVVLGLAPGKYSFRSNDKQSQIEVDLKPGQEYFIRIDIAAGMWKGHGRLTLVLPEQGLGEVKQMKPADEGMIKDRTLLASGFTPEK